MAKRQNLVYYLDRKRTRDVSHHLLQQLILALGFVLLPQLHAANPRPAGGGYSGLRVLLRPNRKVASSANIGTTSALLNRLFLYLGM